jgi:hypothetical protein
MIGIATGPIGTESHAVATPLQAKKRLGSDCDRAFDLPLPSMCDSAAAARHDYTAPFDGAVEGGARQAGGITLLACDRRRLSPARQRRPS